MHYPRAAIWISPCLTLCQIPQNLPCSVTLQPGSEDTGKACGVDYELRAFCAKTVEEKIHQRCEAFRHLKPTTKSNPTQCDAREPALCVCVWVCVCRNSVQLVIRKVQYAPEKPGPQPMMETSRSFLMSDRSLHLEVSLDKEVTLLHTAMTATHTHTHTAKPLSLSSCTTTASPSASTSTSPTTPPRV